MSSSSVAPAPQGSAFFRVGATATVAAVLTLGAIVGSVPSARADVVCSSDSCDGFQWQAARGPANSGSYWGMSPGHNCTNYVAWKLIADGVARPRTSPGDASTWAARATDDGYLVDTTATVGAVAQWNSFEGGNGVDGHVAYVEQVNADGTILLSEDYWHSGDQLGPLTYRTVSVSSVPRFIHYNDISHTIRQVTATASAWSQQSTGLTAYPTAMSAANMGGATPAIVYSEGGTLFAASADATGWHAASTGISSVSRTLAAVNMGGTMPQVLSLEGDVLYLNALSLGGWQKMSTGVRITGDIAAVNAGGLLPTVFVSQGGKLFRVWGDADGWHAEDTAVAVTGAITATMTALGEPEIFSLQAGSIQRSWRDAIGWHSENTGVLATGTLTAVTAGGVTQVILAQDDALYTVAEDADGWHLTETGVVAGSVFAAVDMGGASPLLLQVGGRSSLSTPTAALFTPPATVPPAGSAPDSLEGVTATPSPAVPTPTGIPTIDPTPTAGPLPTADPTPTTSPVSSPPATSAPSPTPDATPSP